MIFKFLPLEANLISRLLIQDYVSQTEIPLVLFYGNYKGQSHLLSHLPEMDRFIQQFKDRNLSIKCNRIKKSKTVIAVA